jgi:hypothetical protein
MERMGYDTHKGEGLNFNRGRRTPLQPFEPRGFRKRRGVGYVTPPLQGESEDDISPKSQSSGSTAWESNVSIGNIFRDLSVNMTLLSHLEDDGKLEPFDCDPWAQQLNYQWEMHFEQREPPTEDEVIQVDVGEEDHPKPIFLSKNLSPQEKEDYISLIQDYIDVFAWSYEDMSGLDPEVAMHRLDIKSDAKLVKQQQR